MPLSLLSRLKMLLESEIGPEKDDGGELFPEASEKGAVFCDPLEIKFLRREDNSETSLESRF